MEAKLATLKSPGLKSNLPSSPTARNFANRQSLALDSTSAFLSPDNTGGNSVVQDVAAATLAQQRAKLKATNAAHRISAPVLASPGPDGRTWGVVASQLSQVSEGANAQEIPINSGSRPKSTEFSGSLNSPRPGEGINEGGPSWASMVNTPLLPMFQNTKAQNIEAAAAKLADWSGKPNSGEVVPRMGDPTIHRRKPPSNDGRGNESTHIIHLLISWHC